jgi:hypothetical protein
MNRYVLIAALGATLAAGCSTTSTTSAMADDDDKMYVTGSRIPFKDTSVNNRNVSANTDRKAIDDLFLKAQQSMPTPGTR